MKPHMYAKSLISGGLKTGDMDLIIRIMKKRGTSSEYIALVICEVFLTELEDLLNKLLIDSTQPEFKKARSDLKKVALKCY